jgi:hypothetical protein
VFQLSDGEALQHLPALLRELQLQLAVQEVLA